MPARQLTSRRAFLQGGSLLLLGAGAQNVNPAVRLAAAEQTAPLLRVGLLTDLHYADRDPGGSRHYRQTPTKLAEAAERFGAEPTDLIVELGDLIDAADSVEDELGYLKRIDAALAACPGTRHYVLGNHCVDTLTKPEFLNAVGQPASYYSFDAGGYHFVVLDACFRSDGTAYGRKNFQWTDTLVPPVELEWLRKDLRGTGGPSIVFVHQRLDVADNYGVKNAAAVRSILQASGNVQAVLQGHYHRNDHKLIEGVHYCTLAAMVEGSGAENNAYAVMEILPGEAIRIRGFRRQESHRWPPEA